jgi:hypothetical protein
MKTRNGIVLPGGRVIRDVRLTDTGLEPVEDQEPMLLTDVRWWLAHREAHSRARTLHRRLGVGLALALALVSAVLLGGLLTQSGALPRDPARKAEPLAALALRAAPADALTAAGAAAGRERLGSEGAGRASALPAGVAGAEPQTAAVAGR